MRHGIVKAGTARAAKREEQTHTAAEKTTGSSNNVAHMACYAQKKKAVSSSDLEILSNDPVNHDIDLSRLITKHLTYLDKYKSRKHYGNLPKNYPSGSVFTLFTVDGNSQLETGVANNDKIYVLKCNLAEIKVGDIVILGFDNDEGDGFKLRKYVDHFEDPNSKGNIVLKSLKHNGKEWEESFHSSKALYGKYIGTLDYLLSPSFLYKM